MGEARLVANNVINYEHPCVLSASSHVKLGHLLGQEVQATFVLASWLGR